MKTEKQMVSLLNKNRRLKSITRDLLNYFLEQEFNWLDENEMKKVESIIGEKVISVLNDSEEFSVLRQGRIQFFRTVHGNKFVDNEYFLYAKSSVGEEFVSNILDLKYDQIIGMSAINLLEN